MRVACNPVWYSSAWQHSSSISLSQMGPLWWSLGEDCWFFPYSKATLKCRRLKSRIFDKQVTQAWAKLARRNLGGFQIHVHHLGIRCGPSSKTKNLAIFLPLPSNCLTPKPSPGQVLQVITKHLSAHQNNLQSSQCCGLNDSFGAAYLGGGTNKELIARPAVVPSRKFVLVWVLVIICQVSYKVGFMVVGIMLVWKLWFQLSIWSD